MKNYRYSNINGFSLIEMLIVIVIISILVGIAFPTYTKQIQSSKRTEGRNSLLDYAMKFEEYYGTNFTYTGADTYYGLNATPVTDNGLYKISASVTSNTYTLTATAQGAQTKDTACPALTLTQTGSKAPSACW